MKLITTHTQQCVLASFAMALDTTMEDLEKQVGHNGLEVILTDLKRPYCYRSFHPQEFVDICLHTGYALTMIELHPAMRHGDSVVDHSDYIGKDRFFKALLLGDGVIFGHVEKYGDVIGHAVAWNASEKRIYDPRGYMYEWTEGQDFYPRQFFLLQKVEEPCMMKSTTQSTDS